MYASPYVSQAGDCHGWFYRLFSVKNFHKLFLPVFCQYSSTFPFPEQVCIILFLAAFTTQWIISKLKKIKLKSNNFVCESLLCVEATIFIQFVCFTAAECLLCLLLRWFRYRPGLRGKIDQTVPAMLTTFTSRLKWPSSHWVHVKCDIAIYGGGRGYRERKLHHIMSFAACGCSARKSSVDLTVKVADLTFHQPILVANYVILRRLAADQKLCYVTFRQPI